MGTRKSNAFTVLEDDDGISVIPSKWLSPNKCHYKWPGNLRYAQINKAILKEKDADNNWDVVKVKQIFTTTSTYDAGLSKAKVAEIITDVDDDEELKKSRSKRKKVIFSSHSSNTSTDEELVSKSKQKRKEVVLAEFPKAPNASNNLQIDLTTNKDNLTRSNSVNSIAPSVSSIGQYGETSISGNSGENEHSLPNDDQGMNDVLGNNNNNGDLPKSVPAYKFLTADEKLNYLCESNALIMNKLNRMIFDKDNKNTQTKCNDKSGTDEKCSTEEIKQVKGSVIYDYFPLKDMNAVEEFEKLLRNKTFTVLQVAQTLLQRGGRKLEVFINYIMQDIFVDEVAVKYSYKGQGERKKTPFKHLLLKDCVFKAAHLFSSNATDEGIKKQISTWLAGAALRLKRKTIKMEDKENKTDEDPIS